MSAIGRAITVSTSHRKACLFRPTGSKCSMLLPTRRHRRRRPGHAPARIGALDVLAQHAAWPACGRPFGGRRSFMPRCGALRPMPFSARRLRRGARFRRDRRLRAEAYERFAKVKEDPYGRWRISNPMIAQRYRMNVGTIVEADMLKVRLVRLRALKMVRRGGRIWGSRGVFCRDPRCRASTFVFAGEIFR